MSDADYDELGSDPAPKLPARSLVDKMIVETAAEFGHGAPAYTLFDNDIPNSIHSQSLNGLYLRLPSPRNRSKRAKRSANARTRTWKTTTINPALQSQVAPGKVFDSDRK